MKKLITLSLVFVMLFAFVACDGEAGGKTNGGGNGGSGELTPAEQAIMNKYGEDTFYLAIFNAHRKPQSCRSYSVFKTDFFRHIGVGLSCRICDESFNTAKAFCILNKLYII